MRPGCYLSALKSRLESRRSVDPSVSREKQGMNPDRIPAKHCSMRANTFNFSLLPNAVRSAIDLLINNSIQGERRNHRVGRNLPCRCET
jgi:hypothetical protein